MLPSMSFEIKIHIKQKIASLLCLHLNRILIKFQGIKEKVDF